MALTGTGVWSGELRFGDVAEAAALAAELESIGYTAAWIPDLGGDLFGPFSNLLAATSTLTIASGIMNVWHHPPAEVGEWWAGLPADQRSRVMLGVGISHGPLIGEQYGRPLATMAEYLDGLDAVGIPQEQRCIAALGPKMLELARTRTGGSHPYLVTPEHTAVARDALGHGALVAPEQGVVLETDPVTARAIARNHLAGYLSLPNYSNNWKRFGITDEDLADGGSDRLVDQLVAWGDDAEIAARVQQHRDAGADHVCVQVLTGDQIGMPLDQWRQLAPALT